MRFDDLTLTDAFVQVDTIKGHRYLDDAGKVMNQWDEEFEEKSVGLEGLTMRTAQDRPLKEAQVTNTKIWVHVTFPPNLTYVIDHCANFTDDVSETLAIEHYRRVGLRLVYVAPVLEMEVAAARLAGMAAGPVISHVSQGDSVDEASVVLRLKSPSLSARLNIATARRNPNAAPDDRRPANAILFDVDLYSEERVEANRAKLVLQRAPRWIDLTLRPTADAYLEAIT